MYLITFYVPTSHLEVVKTALFKSGAGKIGEYEQCAWQTKGQGQFMPLEGSTPYVGEALKVETLEEYKVEMVCERDKIKSVVAALKASHPYETPAYQVIAMESF